MRQVSGYGTSSFQRISWEQANREIAQRANQILDAHGPRSVAFVGGALTSAQAELVFGRGFMAAIIATRQSW